MSENLEVKAGNFSSKNIWKSAIKSGKNLLISSLLGASLLACADSGGGSSSGNSGNGGSSPPTPGNHAPIIYSLEVTQVNENSQYSYDVDASDFDNDPISYSLTQAPGWLSITPSTGLISGTAPSVSADSFFPMRVQASDWSGSFSEQSYTLTVKNISSPSAPSTKLLPDSTLATITSIDANRITFSQPVSNIATGDIIVAGISQNTPSGYLTEVTSVSPDGRTVNTQQSSLERAVSSASFSMRKTLLPNGTTALNALRGVSELNELATGYNFNLALDNVVLYDADGNPATTNDRILANGNLSFSVDADLDFTISNYHLDRFLFQTIISEQSNLTLTSTLSGIAPQGNILIGEYYFSSFIAGYTPTIIPIPIIVTPKIDVWVTASAVGFQSQTSVNQNATLTAGIDYNNGVWTPINVFINNFTFTAPTNPLANSYAEVKAGPSAGLYLYGFLGPSGTINGKLEYISDAATWSLNGGLEATLGVSSKIIGLGILNYSNKVIDNKITLASGNFAPPPPPPTPPPTPTTVTIQPGIVDGKDAFVKWSNFSGSPVPSTNYNTTLLEMYSGSLDPIPQYEGEALIQFPLSSIPSNSTIDSAKLNVYGYCVSNFPVSTLTVDLKKINGLWGESSVTWNTKPTYDTAIISRVEIPHSGTSNWHEFDVKPLVQTWVNSGRTNRGLVLLLEDNESSCAFKSSEHATSSQSPKIVVSYH